MSYLAFLFVFAAVVCWSFNSLLMKSSVKNIDPVLHQLVRMLAGTLCIFLYIISEGTSLTTRPDFLLFASVTGFFSFFVAYGLFTLAVAHGLVHKVWPVGSSTPLWSVISAVLFLSEKPNPVIFISTWLVIIGIFLLGPEGQEEWDQSGRTNNRRGILAALVASFIWGILIVPNKYCLNRGMNPVNFIFIATMAGTIGSLLMLLTRIIRNKNSDESVLGFNQNGIFYSIFSGVIAVFGGNLLWQYGLKIGKASVLSPIVGIETPLVLLLSVLFLKETPTKKALLGVFTVFTGVSLVTTLG